VATVSGLESGLVVEGVEVFTAIGAGGRAEINVSGFSGDKTKLEDSMRNTITVSDDTNSVTWFRGEAVDYTVIDENNATILIDDAAKKVTRMYTGYGNVLTKGVATSTYRNSIFDPYNSDLDTYDQQDGNVFFMVKSDANTYRFRVHPYGVWTKEDDNSTDWTPTDEEGDVYNLSFFDPSYDIPGDDASHCYAVGGANWDGIVSHDDFYLRFYFIFYVKTGTTIKDMTLNLTLQTWENDGHWGPTFDEPHITMYDDTDSEWRQVTDDDDMRDWLGKHYNISDDNFGNTGDDLTGPVQITITKEMIEDYTNGEAFTDFIEDYAEANAAGFEAKRVRCAIYSGEPDYVDNGPLIRLYKAELNVEVDTARTTDTQLGLTSAISGGDAERLEFQDGIDWSVDDYPAAAGFDPGDSYVLTTPLSDVIQDAFDNSDALFDISLLLPTAGLTISSDITYWTLHDLFQYITEAENGWWVYRPDDGSYGKIIIQDNATVGSTGITIEKEDIINYHRGGVTISADTTNQRGKLIGIGATDDLVYELGTAEENEPTIGVESEILRNREITTDEFLEEWVEGQQYRFRNTDRVVEFTLDLSDPPQSYSDIRLGKTIAVQLPTTASADLCDFSSGGDGELLIRSLNLINNMATGGKDYLRLTCQLRHDSGVSQSYYDGYGQCINDWTLDTEPDCHDGGVGVFGAGHDEYFYSQFTSSQAEEGDDGDYGYWTFDDETTNLPQGDRGYYLTAVFGWLNMGTNVNGFGVCWRMGDSGKYVKFGQSLHGSVNRAGYDFNEETSRVGAKLGQGEELTAAYREEDDSTYDWCWIGVRVTFGQGIELITCPISSITGDGEDVDWGADRYPDPADWEVLETDNTNAMDEHAVKDLALDWVLNWTQNVNNQYRKCCGVYYKTF